MKVIIKISINRPLSLFWLFISLLSCHRDAFVDVMCLNDLEKIVNIGIVLSNDLIYYYNYKPNMVNENKRLFFTKVQVLVYVVGPVRDHVKFLQCDHFKINLKHRHTVGLQN